MKLLATLCLTLSCATLADILVADDMTRGQMAEGVIHALEVAGFQPADCVPGEEMFDDVPAENIFCPFIEEVARRGISAGCEPGKFCPDASLSRAQMATFIVKTLEATAGCQPAIPGTGEMVKVGSVCIDRYEASVWTQPNGGTQLITEEQIDAACPDDGQDCKGKIYARSVAGVEPAREITWFQAQQALANSGKRLPTSTEWQMAVSGTPDDIPGPCNSNFDAPVRSTGADAGCVSDWGAFDMVGNVEEWVADWVPHSDSSVCPDWDGFDEFSSNDQMCLSGALTTVGGPGALTRGGRVGIGARSGPFAVRGSQVPQGTLPSRGFRGAR